MIDKMNLHYAFTNPASIHDEEALTALELAGRQGAKINEVVTDQNNLRTQTENKMDAQDRLIDLRLDEQDANIHNMNTVVMPAKVTEEVQEQINDGTFDKAIDKYAGELEARVNNLLSNTPSGSTTMDAEVIDARVGYNEQTFSSLGVAIREQFKIFARRYRNHVRGWSNSCAINFDTTNLTITLNVPTSSYLFCNNNFVSVASGNYVIDYSELTYSAGGSFILAWSMEENKFYVDSYTPTKITEGDPVLMIVYVLGNNQIAQVVGCDDVLSMVHQNGSLFVDNIPSEVKDAHTGYDETVYNTLGIAIREQFKKYAQRYRNHVIGYRSKTPFNVVSENKQILFSPTGSVVFYGNRNYVSVPAGEYVIDYSDINTSYGRSFGVFWSNSAKAFYTKILDSASITENDFLVFVLHTYGNGTINHFIACDDIRRVIQVNGNLHTAYNTPAEVEDAHTGYDGTVHSTLGIAIREQFKKYAQRYRNYLMAHNGKCSIDVDTTNKTITISATNNNLLFGQVGYCFLPAGEHVVDYSTMVQSAGNTFHLLWNNSTSSLEVVDYEPSTITEGRFVLLTIYCSGNGGMNSIIGCDSLLNNIYVNGAKWIVDDSNALTTNKSTCNIFRKVVCCGDSYTSGYIVDSEGVAHPTNEEYAYPHYMSTLTGNAWENCGCSGCNVLTWQTHERGLPKAQSLGKAQAYVIGLMINDCGGSDRHVDIGTVADIGTEAQTYYGGMSKVVESLAAISPDAKIFICTCPNASATYTPYNQAVHDIVEHYKDTYAVHCLDLYANISMYKNASLTGDTLSGHYTAIGYEQFAEILSVIMSNYINDNINKFQDVAFIEYDN